MNCTYVKTTPCTQPATHLCERGIDDATWHVKDRPEQLESLNGFKRSRERIDSQGKAVLDAKGLPVRDPAMQTLEFCQSHAEMVCASRNGKEEHHG